MTREVLGSTISIRRRAQAVKNYLIGLGISPDRVSTVSYGKERPAVVGSNDGAWAQNRRSVTIVN